MQPLVVLGNVIGHIKSFGNYKPDFYSQQVTGVAVIFFCLKFHFFLFLFYYFCAHKHKAILLTNANPEADCSRP